MGEHCVLWYAVHNYIIDKGGGGELEMHHVTLMFAYSDISFP